MTNYFKYQLEQLPQNPLDRWTHWEKFRGGDNLMVIYWLYNIIGDKFLLELGDLATPTNIGLDECFSRRNSIDDTAQPAYCKLLKALKNLLSIISVIMTASKASTP